MKLIQDITQPEFYLNEPSKDIMLMNCKFDFAIIEAKSIDFIDCEIKTISIEGVSLYNDINCGVNNDSIIQFVNCTGSINTNYENIEVFGNSLIINNAEKVHYFYKKGDNNIAIFNEYPFLNELLIDNEYGAPCTDQLKPSIKITNCSLY